MAVIVNIDFARSYWPQSEGRPEGSAETKRESEPRVENVTKRPYDWSNIAFAVDYCEKAKREYDERSA